MDFEKLLDEALRGIKASETSSTNLVERIRSEIEFAHQFMELYPEKKKDWEPLLLEAAKIAGETSDLESVVQKAEKVLSPIGEVAKQYTVYCCAHAHIDMNWLWPWQETVSVCHDTFSTVDRLMEEFPDFCFCQSQASTYLAMEEHCPEIFEMIKRRASEGRWEITASMWVEGDKNMASGESLCRHILYTRRYFSERFGLPYDAVKIDWEGDTFGHAYTLPTILNRGGVNRYYHCRTGPDKWLMWWQGPDSSRVLLFLDKAWYLGPVTPDMSKYLVDYVKETGLKDFMWLYGVGDHGGGPTRKDLINAIEMDTWPIWPNVKLSTSDAYFSAVEKVNPDLPVHDGELNFVFDGCYTSESNIKLANRIGENVVPEVEAISLAVGKATGFPYPMEKIRQAWQYVMFNQFHDILPGSGIPDTYRYSQGLFQEIQAITGSIRTRALRRLADHVNTSKASGEKQPSGKGADVIGDSIGAGVGDFSLPGGVSAYSPGPVGAEPVLVFNPLAFTRSSVIAAKVWNTDYEPNKVIVRDETGKTVAGQVAAQGRYMGHNYTKVIFPAENIPGVGYKVYTIDRSPVPVIAEYKGVTWGAQGAGSISINVQNLTHTDEVRMESSGVMENRFVRVEIDPMSGAIKSLIDKTTGYEYVPEGRLLGVLELYQEAPNEMTAWVIGQIKKRTELTDEGTMTELMHGPHRAAVKTDRKINESEISVEIGLNAGSPMVDFTVTANWLERGTQEKGVPMLKVAFPISIVDPKVNYEIPFGSISRPVNGQEVPALKWADLSGNRTSSNGVCGITLVNDCKYGHNAEGNILRLTLLRSSENPDPLPEMGKHKIRFAIIPHEGTCPVSDASRAGAAFNMPMNVVNTDVHEGELPASKGYTEVLTPNIMLAGLKRAEDSDNVIIRLYEMEGRDTEAKVRLTDLVKPGSPAVETDLMEQPLASSSARMDGDTVIVKIPAHGVATVMVG